MLLLEASNPTALFETTKGNITNRIKTWFSAKAVENFVTHAKNGYYNGLFFIEL